MTSDTHAEHEFRNATVIGGGDAVLGGFVAELDLDEDGEGFVEGER